MKIATFWHVTSSRVRSDRTEKLMSFSAKRCAYCPRPSFSSHSVTCCIIAAPSDYRASPARIAEFIPNGYTVGVEVGTCSQFGKVLAYKARRCETQQRRGPHGD